MKYYIYTLSDPISLSVRYIGRTNNISRRYAAHLCEKSKSRKNSWIKSLIKDDLLPVIEVLQECDTEGECIQEEIYWIAQFKQWGFDLTNLHDGGIGGSVGKRVGESNTSCKTPEKDVLGIIALLLNTDMTIDDIGRKFNVKPSHVYRISNGDCWNHLTNFKNNKERRVRKKSVEKRAQALKNLGVYDKQSIKVLQCDIENNFIAEYKSISEACKITGTNRTSLSQCLSGKFQKANNFIWKKK